LRVGDGDANFLDQDRAGRSDVDAGQYGSRLVAHLACDLTLGNRNAAEPDLLIRMPEAYQLAPSGPDTFRTFVMPIPGTSKNLVRVMGAAPAAQVGVPRRPFPWLDARTVAARAA
jgi:hypothetical protein